MALSAGIDPEFSLMKAKKTRFLGCNEFPTREHAFNMVPQSRDSSRILEQRDSEPYIHAGYIG